MSVTDLTSGLNFCRHNDAATDAVPLPALILTTDDARLADPLPAVRRLPRGSAVIFRHYTAPDRAGLAQSLIAAARPLGIKVLIAADARLAARLGADGLHLPDALAARGPGAWILWRRPGWLVTASAHSPAGLWRAFRTGADAALLAPVYPTASHPERPPIGPIRFARWCRESPLPVYALGGVKGNAARRLGRSGAAGLAGIGAFQTTPGRLRHPDSPAKLSGYGHFLRSIIIHRAEREGRRGARMPCLS
jgi:thiamine-phosphate pyrophosphorylase